MKKFLTGLISFIIICRGVAQSSGDYRSISNGNWNDPTNWQIYNGSSWVITNSYPGQNSGTGEVTIANQTEINLTATIPYPIASLYVKAEAYCFCYDDNYDSTAAHGVLRFSSESVISLVALGGITIDGQLLISDETGAKTHQIYVGGSLIVGNEWYAAAFIYDELYDYYYWEYYYYQTPTVIRTINQDDKLDVTFNTAHPNSVIGGLSTIRIPFQNITFNGTGIGVVTGIEINGTATFTNGIVRSHNGCSSGYACDASPSSYCPPPVSNCGSILFNDGATVVGASVNSFVDGRVSKQGDDPFTFPIGNGGVYSPLTISIPVGQVATLSARYARMDGVYPVSSGIADPALYSVSDCEYWELNPSPSSYGDNSVGYPVNITVGWNSSSNCSSSPYVTDVSDVTLARLNFFGVNGWESHGGSAAGTIENGTVTWAGVMTLGTFTLGNLNTNCVPPSLLTTTNITTNSASLNWSAVPGSQSYDVDYRHTNTLNWTNIATGTTARSFSLSGLNTLNSYDWRVRAACNSSSSAYRLAKFTTQNPCSTPGGLTTTQITSGSALVSWGAVPTAYNYSVQYKLSSESSWSTSNSFSATSPSFSFSGLAASTAYDWRVTAICGPFDYNTYYGSGDARASFTTLAPTVCNDAYEPNNTSAQAKTIALGSLISAIISSSTDVDWFKVNMPNSPNAVLQVSLTDLPADYDLYVYDKNLFLVGSSTAFGTVNDGVVINSIQRKGLYYIKVVGKNGAYDVSKCYHLLVQAVGTPRPEAAASDLVMENGGRPMTALLYPNPASEFVFLNFNSVIEGVFNMQIINSIGQLVKQYPVTTIEGFNQFKIHVNDIRPGMYILRINKGDLNITRKFVIAR